MENSLTAIRTPINEQLSSLSHGLRMRNQDSITAVELDQERPKRFAFTKSA